MSDVFATRRARVLSALGADGALVVAASPELVIGADTEVRYVASSDLYYLTGYTEPEAVLVLCPSADSACTMFVRPRDPDRELWTGVRGGVEVAREKFGADAAHSVGELAAALPKLLSGASRVHAALDTGRPAVDAALRSALVHARRARPRHGRGVHTVIEPAVLLGPMRLRKDATELAALRRAADMSVQSFDDAARGLRDATHEYHVEAAIEYGFRRRGASGPAFPTIAAAGANATVLHYTTNDAPLRPGDLILVDAGARADMYCADITRTYPVSGRYSAEQRALYDVVQEAHDAAVAAIEPGRAVSGLEEAALHVLVRGMVDLGLLAGDVDGLIESKAYRAYFPHRVSHWLGLDVHDTGDYEAGDSPVQLEEGMVLTVEPGLYVPAADGSAPAALRGIGIRLENDVAVAAGGADVLTGALPLRAEEVEAQLRG